MPKLPVLTAKQTLKKFKKAGFRFYRDGPGSHEYWYHPETKRSFAISIHPGKTIKKGTLRKMLRDAGLTIEEFTQL